jgi:hypothetical protein
MDSRENHSLLEDIKAKYIMELFRGSSKPLRLDILVIKSDVTDMHLGYNIFAIQQQLVDITSQIEETSRESTSVIDTTHALMKQLYGQETIVSPISAQRI